MQDGQQQWHLTVDNLACRRGDRILFHSLSLALTSGQALHVRGANGIGKSSLIRIIAGLMPAYTGAVTREGTIGLIDERLSMEPHRPLGKSLNFWAEFDHAPAERVAKACNRLGLSDLLDVPARYLSTGQRKRAAFARLLSQAPAIWLLDEPFNGLDSDAVALVEALCAEHCAQGGICVLASHQSFSLPGMRTLDLQEFAA